MLLPFIVASTSLLSAFPGGPAAEAITVDSGRGHPITVEVALSRAEGEVPVPIRFTGGDIDVEVAICDGSSCTGARTILVPAHTVVQDVAIVEDGRPNLLLTNAVVRPDVVPCCEMQSASGRVVAVVGPALPSEAVSTFVNGNAVVYALAVGRLLDERPEQIGNVGAVVLRDGDLDHDAAFFANLRRFVRLGGLVSVDKAQAARLDLGPPTPLAALQTHDLAAFPGSSAVGTFDIALADGRRIRSIDADTEPRVQGAIHVVDNGLVVVRDGELPPIDAVTELVQARRRFINARRIDWRANGDFTNAVLVGLQPNPSPLPMVLWFVLTSLIAVVAARAVVARRPGLGGPVAGAFAVVVVLTLSGGVAVGASFTSSSWRSTAIRVVGPGRTLHATTLVTARSPDFNVERSALHVALDGDTRSFIAAGYNARRSHFGAAIAEVTVRTDIEEGPGHLLSAYGESTNRFDHVVDIHPRTGTVVVGVAPGATVVTEDSFTGGRRADIVPVHVQRVVEAIQQRCQCAVATFTDDDGLMHVVEGTVE